MADYEAQFLSTPSARRATRPSEPFPQDLRISIHALCEEGDALWARCGGLCGQFLSTPSARRATHTQRRGGGPLADFYPRPLRGGRHRELNDANGTIEISIHALCEEGDGYLGLREDGDADFYPRPLRGGRPGSIGFTPPPSEFLSTPSARRATVSIGDAEKAWAFLSTPSARRATSSRPPNTTRPTTFLSTPSARRATKGHVLQADRVIFLSTPSARRATTECSHRPPGWLISIHALCEEGDEQLAYRAALDAKFLSTPSARRATCTYQTPIRNKEISIHALCEEGDPRLHTRVQISTYFYPRPLRGGRLLQDCP